ncbi:hypothetical protein U1Q18_038288 [Sarracenia purpurea var. burkii]
MGGRQWSLLTKMAASFCLDATSTIATTVVNNLMYTVDGGQCVVIFDRSRGVVNETVGERTYFLIPGLQRAFIFNILTRPHAFVTVSCTKDLQMVGLTLHVLYSPEAVIVQFQADELLIHSTRISALVCENLISRAKDFNIVVDDLSITHTLFGTEFTKAVEQKQVAQQVVLRSKFMVAKAEQESRATIIKVEAESESAKLIRDAISAVGMDWIEFKRIEASKEIAATLVKNPNVVWKKYP